MIPKRIIALYFCAVIAAVLVLACFLDSPLFTSANSREMQLKRRIIESGGPDVVLFGSSRAASAIAPRILAQELKLPPQKVVSAAHPGPGGLAVVARYLEYEPLI